MIEESCQRTALCCHAAVAWLLLLPAPCSCPAADDGPLQQIATIELAGKPGTLDHLYVDSSSARLFLTNQTNDTLDIIDLKANRLAKQLRDQKTSHSVVYVPSLDRIFVSSGAGFCNVFDGTSYALAKSLEIDGADSVRFDARTGRVAVASRKGLTVIDAKTLEIMKRIELPGSPHGFQVAKDRPAIYVNVEPPAQVAVIDAERNEVVTSYPLAGDHKSIGPITIDEPNGRLLVGLRAKPRLAVLDMSSGQEIASLPIPEGPDDMFLDPESKSIYVSCNAGFIATIRQIDANRYERLGELATTKGAKTSFYDPILKCLYLAVPRREGKSGPEIWVYQPRP